MLFWQIICKTEVLKSLSSSISNIFLQDLGALTLHSISRSNYAWPGIIFFCGPLFFFFHGGAFFSNTARFWSLSWYVSLDIKLLDTGLVLINSQSFVLSGAFIPVLPSSLQQESAYTCVFMPCLFTFWIDLACTVPLTAANTFIHSNSLQEKTCLAGIEG